MDKEEFEEMKERVEAQHADFKKGIEDKIDEIKQAKEGWEDSHAEDYAKQYTAEREETHQTH